MRAFVKDRNYVFMFERSLDDIAKVQNRSLEAEVLDESNSFTGKKAIVGYKKIEKLFLWKPPIQLESQLAIKLSLI